MTNLRSEEEKRILREKNDQNRQPQHHQYDSTRNKMMKGDQECYGVASRRSFPSWLWCSPAAGAAALRNIYSTLRENIRISQTKTVSITSEIIIVGMEAIG